MADLAGDQPWPPTRAAPGRADPLPLQRRQQPRHPVWPRGAILEAGERATLLERRGRPTSPPLTGGRRRDATTSRRSTTRKAALHLSDQRPPASESETSVTVKPHPGPPSTVSLRRPTASKEARMTYSAVHNLSRHVS